MLFNVPINPAVSQAASPFCVYTMKGAPGVSHMISALTYRVATVREKVLENEKNSRSGKSQGITFSVREILKKNEKSHEKVREFQNFL